MALISHCVQAKNSQLVGYNLRVVPSASLKLMPLLFRDKLPPDVQILHCPPVRSLEKNVVWHHVIVAKRWYNWHDEIVRRIRIIGILVVTEHFDKLAHEELILLNDLVFASRKLLIVVMSCGISSPYHKVYRVFDVLVDPLEGRVDKGERSVAVRRFCAIEPSGAVSTVAREILLGGGVGFVVWVGVEI